MKFLNIYNFHKMSKIKWNIGGYLRQILTNSNNITRSITLSKTHFSENQKLILKETSNFSTTDGIALSENSLIRSSLPISSIVFKNYEDGMTEAHNYPNKALPKHSSKRIPSRITIYPFTTAPLGDIQYTNRFSAKSINVKGITTCRHQPVQLFERLFNRTSIVYLFSDDSPYSSASAVIDWKDKAEKIINNKKVQHCFLCVKRTYPWNEWLIRNGTQFLTPQFAPHGNFMGYFGSILPEMTETLHLYRPQLITVLLVDPQCKIRWHSVGNVTEEALSALRHSISTLTSEVSSNQERHEIISINSKRSYLF